MQWIDQISWTTVLLICATLGLAPFVPEPHIWEKLKMLAAGTLVAPLDWFDLLFHGLPWGVALLKAVRSLQTRQ
ncbi:MAG: RND transporter [Rhodobacteraceae bacterium]|nr:RND transporter [Paracoccaceae bacterium]|tara:strand:- start:278 stop:499 length:222 start_codon:yes stop_codon:yes gene_type:complete